MALARAFETYAPHSLPLSAMHRRGRAFPHAMAPLAPLPPGSPNIAEFVNPAKFVHCDGMQRTETTYLPLRCIVCESFSPSLLPSLPRTHLLTLACTVPRLDVLALRSHAFAKGDHTSRDAQEAERLKCVQATRVYMRAYPVLCFVFCLLRTRQFAHLFFLSFFHAVCG